MRGKYLFQRNLLIAGVALFLLAGWHGIWQPLAVPSAWASTQTESPAASDAERLKIALEVLESEGTRLRKLFESEGECNALRQAKEVVEAILALAPGESEIYQRTRAEWLIIANSITLVCDPYRPSAAGSGGANGNVPTSGGADGNAPTVIITGAGGCTNGMIAELLTQDPPFIQGYAERTGIEIDLPAIFDAGRVLLDVTPNAPALGDWGTDMTISTKCGSRGPGVKGMSEAILAYPLLPQSERYQWMQSIQAIKVLPVPAMPINTGNE
ncbi:MAG: hypothetical protein KJZ86_08770 [Caldilineaceae bacterium]|nr:hypothetical protein [Caldilineaceae bacterium]